MTPAISLVAVWPSPGSRSAQWDPNGYGPVVGLNAPGERCASREQRENDCQQENVNNTQSG